jgi:predicted transcriptional regulator of viral defense system
VTKSDISVTFSKSSVANVAEWRANGVGPARLRAMARSGELVRVWHGVYATRTAVEFAQSSPRRGHALRTAAVQASVGRDAVASHHSAAVIHGLDLYPSAPDLVTLTRPPERRSNRLRSEGIIFHTAQLPVNQATTRYGVAITTVPRTVIDLARLSTFMSAVVTADSALRSEAANKAALLKACDACAGWPGIQRARRAVDFADPLAGSVLESCARVVFAEYGIEPPELQWSITGPNFRFSVDFCWPRYRVVAETDGAMKYADPRNAIKQLDRDRLLRDAGYKVVHLTWRELFANPQVVITRIRQAFAAPTAV